MLQLATGPSDPLPEGEQDGAAGAGVGAQDEAAQDVHDFHRLAHTLKLARSLSIKYEINASIDVPYSMIANLETYAEWMPWCTSGLVLPNRPKEADEAAPGTEV